MAWESRIVGHGEAAPADLVGNPRNWRTHPKAQRDALAGVLDQVGWVQDVIVNKRTGYLVDGHARVAVAAQRGETSVPVVYVDLSEDEELLILATLDPLAAMAEADAEVLADLLASVTSEDAALTSMLDALAKAEGIDTAVDGLTDPDDVPAERETTVQRGEVYRLGAHRLMCGDSTSAEDVALLLDGQRIERVFTSPPYDQQRTYEGGMAPDWLALMDSVFSVLTPRLETAAQLFVNLGLVHRNGRVVRYWDGWLEACDRLGLPLFGWYVWDKLDGMPGDWNGRLAPAHEWVFHLTSAPERPSKTVPTKHAGKQVGSGQRKPDGSLKAFTGAGDPIQPFKIMDSVIRLSPAKGGVKGHPAPFPVGLPEQFIEAYGGGMWFDPFTGSGTTIIAAERQGRTCYAMEIEPKYVQVCIDRWEAFTGLKAERV